ncbi:hypothetical protein [Amycolatopsis alba]|uniref:Uncharacterized protein n=1 Tax=Amycolatopsis alba DSM 44262 TaxID=1125972 RepID=A0A229RF25_AMYAL|nr:hypothetical protein [Amycolatopsis alba]OXM45273.1 hypothetical protein CFP75_31500 [Amycolatopsis alba DSM 44262]
MSLFSVTPGARAEGELARVLATGPFSKALSRAIDHSGLGLGRVKERLARAGVSISTTTLSYWRTGRTRPERPESLRAVALLEELLGLPAKSLLDLLHRPEDDLPAFRRLVGWDRLWDPREPVLSVLHSFESSDEPSLMLLSLHESLHIGTDRALTRQRVREVVRATDEPVQTRVVVLRGCAPGSPPRLSATRYCVPGRTEVLPDQALIVSELVSDRLLAPGETAIFEYEFEYTDGVPDDRYDRRFRHSMPEHLLEIHFAPEAMPERCHSYRLDHASGPERDVTDVPLSTLSPAITFTSAVRPGIRGMSWTWPAEPG